MIVGRTGFGWNSQEFLPKYYIEMKEYFRYWLEEPGEAYVKSDSKDRCRQTNYGKRASSIYNKYNEFLSAGIEGERQDFIGFQDEQQEYIQAMKTERDIRNYIKFAHKQGREEGKIPVARNLKNSEISADVIVLSTGLTMEQVLQL